MNNVFLPSAGRYGVMSVMTEAGNVGALAPVIANGGTTIYRMPTLPRASVVQTLGVQCSTLTASAGAVTAQVFKRNATGALSKALTGTFDLLTANLAVGVVKAIPITATEADRTLKVGDYLAVDVVAAGSVTTQPIDFFVSAEVALRN